MLLCKNKLKINNTVNVRDESYVNDKDNKAYPFSKEKYRNIKKISSPDRIYESPSASDLIQYKNQIQTKLNKKDQKNVFKLRELLRRVEDNLSAENPWYLQGEIEASRRPINSALGLVTGKKIHNSSSFKSNFTESCLKSIITTKILNKMKVNRTEKHIKTHSKPELSNKIITKTYDAMDCTTLLKNKTDSSIKKLNVTEYERIGTNASIIFQELHRRLKLLAHF